MADEREIEAVAQALARDIAGLGGLPERSSIAEAVIAALDAARSTQPEPEQNIEKVARQMALAADDGCFERVPYYLTDSDHEDRVSWRKLALAGFLGGAPSPPEAEGPVESKFRAARTGGSAAMNVSGSPPDGDRAENVIRVASCCDCGEMLGVEDHIRIQAEHFSQVGHQGLRFDTYMPIAEQPASPPEAEGERSACPTCEGRGYEPEFWDSQCQLCGGRRFVAGKAEGEREPSEGIERLREITAEVGRLNDRIHGSAAPCEYDAALARKDAELEELREAAKPFATLDRDEGDWWLEACERLRAALASTGDGE